MSTGKVKTIVNNPLIEIHEQYITAAVEDLSREVGEDIYVSNHTELGSSNGWVRCGDLLIKQQLVIQHRSQTDEP